MIALAFVGGLGRGLWLGLSVAENLVRRNALPQER
jgi:hypothetical protein